MKKYTRGDLIFMGIIFCIFGYIVGALLSGYYMRNWIEQFNSTHTFFLNSSIQTEQECQIIEKNASERCFIFREQAQEDYNWCLKVIEESRFYIFKALPITEEYCEVFLLNKKIYEEICMEKFKNQTYNETVCNPKPIKECVEWEQTATYPCDCIDKSIECCKSEEQFNRGELFPTITVYITNISNLVVHNESCTKWKYNFEVEE